MRGWSAFTAALLEAVTVAVHLQDVKVMGEPIEQGAGEPRDSGSICRFLVCNRLLGNDWLVTDGWPTVVST
jgi:hypothetical protein